MKNSSKWCKILALILCITLFSTIFAGCGKKDETTSENNANNVIYGDATDEADDDDEYVSTTSGGGTTSGGKTSGGKTGGGSVIHVDENKKKDFINSVPKKLKGTTVKILTWWEPRIAEKAKMEYFEKKTGIKIKWVVTSSADYLSKLSSMRAQNSPPDLACITNNNFPAAVMSDYFQPLSVGKIDLSKTDVYDIDSMNQYKYNGKLYGAIVKGSTMLTLNFVAYNKDMFSKYGVKTPDDYWQGGKNGNDWNWETFLQCAKEVKSKARLKSALASENQMNFFAQSVGTDIVKWENNKLINNIKDQRIYDAWKFIDELSVNSIQKVFDGNFNTASFYDQSAAMVVTGNYNLQKGDVFEKNVKFNFGYVPIPSPKGQKTVISAAAKLWGFPVGSKNQEAASYALEYWLDRRYDVSGKELWMNDGVAAFCDWMWNQPKCLNFGMGVIEYGGDYQYGRFTFEMSESVEKIKTTIDKWSGVIDANIKLINSENK